VCACLARTHHAAAECDHGPSESTRRHPVAAGFWSSRVERGFGGLLARPGPVRGAPVLNRGAARGDAGRVVARAPVVGVVELATCRRWQASARRSAAPKSSAATAAAAPLPPSPVRPSYFAPCAAACPAHRLPLPPKRKGEWVGFFSLSLYLSSPPPGLLAPCAAGVLLAHCCGVRFDVDSRCFALGRSSRRISSTSG
jgi:hypothetical protein